jgi:hypothetical protein
MVDESTELQPTPEPSEQPVEEPAGSQVEVGEGAAEEEMVPKAEMDKNISRLTSVHQKQLADLTKRLEQERARQAAAVGGQESETAWKAAQFDVLQTKTEIEAACAEHGIEPDDPRLVVRPGPDGRAAFYESLDRVAREEVSKLKEEAEKKMADAEKIKAKAESELEKKGQEIEAKLRKELGLDRVESGSPTAVPERKKIEDDYEAKKADLRKKAVTGGTSAENLRALRDLDTEYQRKLAALEKGGGA